MHRCRLAQGVSLVACRMQQANRLIHGKSGYAGLYVGNSRRNRRVKAVQIEGDIDWPAGQNRLNRLDWPAGQNRLNRLAGRPKSAAQNHYGIQGESFFQILEV